MSDGNFRAELAASVRAQKRLQANCERAWQQVEISERRVQQFVDEKVSEEMRKHMVLTCPECRVIMGISPLLYRDGEIVKGMFFSDAKHKDGCSLTPVVEKPSLTGSPLDELMDD